MSNDGTIEKANSITESGEEELLQQRIDDLDHRTRESWKLKRSKSSYISTQVTVLEVIEEMKTLFKKAVEYCMYRLIEWSARYDDVVVQELRHMAEKATIQMEDSNSTGRTHTVNLLPTELKTSLQCLQNF